MSLPEVASNLPGLSLLSAMITPAVLISACGTLIFSTATRLARIVDRVRNLAFQLEQIFTGQVRDFAEERRRAIDEQIGFYAQRSRLVQGALTSFYMSPSVRSTPRWSSRFVLAGCTRRGTSRGSSGG